jgi:hypothetical protein
MSKILKRKSLGRVEVMNEGGLGLVELIRGSHCEYIIIVWIELDFVDFFV